ncbi:MAG: CHAT domain-containing protein [Gemmatimonadetes bacterium]|nr:CHAT domain-containing protein [Gemmatimonadota bacterium]
MSMDHADAAAEVILAWWTGAGGEDLETRHLYQRLVRAVDVSGDLRATVTGDPVRGRSHLAAVLRDAAARHPVVASLVRQVAPAPAANARPSSLSQVANATGDGSIAINVGGDYIADGRSLREFKHPDRDGPGLPESGGRGSARPSSVGIILLVSAEPEGLDRLYVGREERVVEDELDSRSRRAEWTVQCKRAVRFNDLDRLLRAVQPRILHFSGHGGEDGIFLEDDAGNAQLVRADALARLLAAARVRLDCIVMNACRIGAQAPLLAAHARYVIAATDWIPDEAAIAFSRGFYAGLADGDAIPAAYERACAHFCNATDSASPPDLVEGTG